MIFLKRMYYNDLFNIPKTKSKEILYRITRRRDRCPQIASVHTVTLLRKDYEQATALILSAFQTLKPASSSLVNCQEIVSWRFP